MYLKSSFSLELLRRVMVRVLFAVQGSRRLYVRAADFSLLLMASIVSSMVMDKLWLEEKSGETE
jgi:hypothetical protein